VKVLVLAQDVKALHTDEDTEVYDASAAVLVVQAERTQSFSAGVSVQKAWGVGVAVAKWEEKQELAH